MLKLRRDYVSFQFKLFKTMEKVNELCKNIDLISRRDEFYVASVVQFFQSQFQTNINIYLVFMQYYELIKGYVSKYEAV